MELGNSGVSGSGKEEAVPDLVVNICFGYFMFKRLRQLTFFCLSRFLSRERFGERNAKTWWEENRERIQAQYL